MRNLLLIFSMILLYCLNTHAQVTKVWDKTLGGSGTEGSYAPSIINTSDGGIVIAGTSSSPASGDKSENSKGGQDYWVVRLNANRQKVWDKTIGGSGDDFASSIIATSDGGFIIAGTSLSPASGDKSENRIGGMDYWVIKLNANGQKIWDKTIGGDYIDILSSLCNTPDGGVVIAGWTSSSAYGDKSENSKGWYDYWIVKLNANGQKVWDRTIGGSESDYPTSVIATADGGFVIAGYSNSPASGDKSENSKGDSDYWIVKLNANGQKIWDKTIGGSGLDKTPSVVASSDGGFIIAGTTLSPVSGDKSENNKGEEDYWIVKLNANGQKIWDKTIGGSGQDISESIIATSDGGFVIAGSSKSPISGDKSENTQWNHDYWIVKINANRQKVWDKTIGGIYTDWRTSVIATANGDIVIAGLSNSGVSDDKSENSKGGDDYWIVKLSESAMPQCPMGNISFSTQAQIDNFIIQYPTCTEIDGNVYISGADITNLAGLSNITSIGGNLILFFNSSLTNLDDFSALTSLGGYLELVNNATLENIDGLSYLTNIYGSNIQIFHNNALTNIDGLSALTSINGSLVIRKNNILTNVGGLSTLTNIGGSLSILENAELSSVDGLSALENIGGNLNIANNNPLTNINALSNLESIGGYIYIESNATLTDISGLTNIDPATIEDLYIQENPNLAVCNLPNLCTYLSNPSNPRTIGGNKTTCLDAAAVVALCACPTGDVTFTTQAQIDSFIIEYPTCTEITGNVSIWNGNITNLNGLSNITSIGGNLGILMASSLTNVDGLSNLASVGGGLTFNTTSLTNIDGLSNLESIGEGLFIWSNSALTNINGLSLLTNINQRLSIQVNNNLTNTDGLRNITNVGDRLDFANNANLTSINLSSLTSVGGGLDIYGNPSLANLDDLSTLTNVGGSIFLNANASLTNVYGLSNIFPTTFTSLTITNNPQLEVCNLPNFCTYLSNPSTPRSIIGNKTTCLDATAVMAACCPPSRTHSGSVASGTYKAGQTIQSTANVSTGTVYQAGKSITLSPGFRAGSNEVFEARIGGCN